MKRTYYLLLFVLILSASAKAQTAWTTTKLDDKMSVKFPSEPKKTTVNNIDTYAVMGKDSIGYVAVMIDFNVIAHMDEATLAGLKDSQEFADQFKTGFVSSRPEFNIGDITIGKWKGNTMYTMSGLNKNNKTMMSAQTVIIGTKMYMQSCVLPANTGAADKEKFFSSLEEVK